MGVRPICLLTLNAVSLLCGACATHPTSDHSGVVNITLHNMRAKYERYSEILPKLQAKAADSANARITVVPGQFKCYLTFCLATYDYSTVTLVGFLDDICDPVGLVSSISGNEVHFDVAPFTKDVPPQLENVLRKMSSSTAYIYGRPMQDKDKDLLLTAVAFDKSHYGDTGHAYTMIHFVTSRELITMKLFMTACVITRYEAGEDGLAPVSSTHPLRIETTDHVDMNGYLSSKYANDPRSATVLDAIIDLKRNPPARPKKPVAPLGDPPDMW